MRALLVLAIVILAGCTSKPDPTVPTPQSSGTTIGIPVVVNESEVPASALTTNVTVETLLLRAPLDAALDEPTLTPRAEQAWRAVLADYRARVAENASREGSPFVAFPELRPVVIDDFLANTSLPTARIVVTWTSHDVLGLRCNCSARFVRSAQRAAEVQPQVLAVGDGVDIDPALDPAFGNGTRSLVLLVAPPDLWTVYDHNATEAEAHDRELYARLRNDTLERAAQLLPGVMLSPFEDLVDTFEAEGLSQRDVDVLRAMPEVRAVRAA